MRGEAEVMEKLRHDHIVKLVGTYSIHNNGLYLLIWPVAQCNLSQFLDDIDNLRTGHSDRGDIIRRLEALELGDLSAVDPNADASSAATALREACPLNYLQRLLGCITSAIAYCHRENIRHLDLKPSNILLTPSSVYLADFGIARDVHDRDHTMTYGIQGTARWIAPEIYHPRDEWSMRAADVYSLGLVFLNVATVVYGARLSEFDELRADPRHHGGPEKLRQYLAKLQVLALATQQVADHDAHTFAPRHVVDLVSRMTAHEPGRRPAAERVETMLVELGGIDQVYHNTCCKKQGRALTSLMDTRLKVCADENARLRQDNESMARHLREIEGRDETLLQRLENERRQHARNAAALQEQLRDEQNKRRQLEDQLAERRRQHRPAGFPRAERSTSGGGSSANNSPLTMRVSPPRAHPIPQSRPQPPNHNHHRQPSASFATAAAAAATRPPRPTGIPSPAAAAPASPAAAEASPLLRSRGSGSRLPIAVNPATPLRSRAGTPALLRDPSLSLTDSTQYSLADSTFSRLSGVSRDSETVPSPLPGGSPLLSRAGGAASNQTVRGDAMISRGQQRAGVGLGIGEGGDDRGGTRAGASGRESAGRGRVGSVVSSTASQVGGGTPSASVVSSPRLGRAELELLAAASGGVRIPPSLPTARSWADVARR